MGDLPPDVTARLEQSRQDAIRAKREGVLLTRRPLRRGEDPRSYMGGLPRLREDLDWPVSAKTGLPLSFIAQIDLRDVPRPSGVFFPAEGLLWFFADFSEGTFEGDRHTRVLFDPHPRTMAGERAAPANLPPLESMGYDRFGWVKARHPRVFVEPKAGLLLDLFDTFYDRPYMPPPTWEDFFRAVLTPWHKREKTFDEHTDFGPGVYMRMIEELRREALHRAIGPRTRYGGNWHEAETGFREAHWPATSIDAEYALMSLAREYESNTGQKDHSCPPDVVEDLAARLEDQITIMRGLGPRPLAQQERAAIKALVEKVRRLFVRHEVLRTRAVRPKRMRAIVRSSRWTMDFAIEQSYPFAVFEILSTMPEAEKYVPAKWLDPYQEGPVGQMFGHGAGLQGAPQIYEDRGFVLLFQITGFARMGFSQNGIMHYWIPRRDLARGRFDRVEGTWETD